MREGGENLTLLTIVNSPASTLLLYIFEVKGSVLSLLPIICAVDAVGIGAISSELRTPANMMNWRVSGRFESWGNALLLWF